MDKIEEYMKEDMKEIFSIIEKDFMIRSFNIKDLLDYQLKESDNLYYPLLVISSFKLFSSKLPPHHMAAVIYFIHVATKIHKYKGQSPEYFVLVGDYIYSKFFSYLCKYDSLEWLTPLSNIICEIHEKNAENEQKKCSNITNKNITAVQRESALLGSISCEIGASYGVNSNYVKDNMKYLGYSLGLIKATSLKEKNNQELDIFVSEANEYLHSVYNYIVDKSLFDIFKETINNYNNNNIKSKYVKVV